MSAGYPYPCPSCEHGELYVSDAIYADCDNCDATVRRDEVDGSRDGHEAGTGGDRA